MHLSLGSERDAVYPFLDFTKDYDLAVKYVLGMTFGAQSGTILKSNYGMKLFDIQKPCHGIAWSLSHGPWAHAFMLSCSQAAKLSRPMCS